jgi:membrane associated rhomboid family serine protease
MNGYGRGFFRMTPVVQNIIIANILMFIAFKVGGAFDINLNRILGLYFPKSESFMPVQIISHMFMHANFMHIFFNMYALYIFGQALENVWGPKRFLTFYLVSGLGAALVYESVIAFEFHNLAKMISPEALQTIIKEGVSGEYSDVAMQSLQVLLNMPVLGASGAVFGILLAFGVLFPNTQLMLLFPPIPIKAKYFVLIYGAIELYLAFSQPGSTIAHTAHLGGMLFGYLLIVYWRKTTKTLY